MPSLPDKALRRNDHQSGEALAAAYRARLRRRRLTLIPLLALVAAAALYALGLGAYPLGWGVVWRVVAAHLTGHASHSLADSIVWQIRAPRVLLGLLVGAALAGSGAIYQALFRNPMADPYIIGVSAGAALGAVIEITLQAPLIAFAAHLGPFRWIWVHLTSSRPVFAFALGIATVILVYRIALRSGRAHVTTLLLAGIAASSLLSSLMALLEVFNTRGQQLSGVVRWLLGGLEDRTWGDVSAVYPWILIGLALALVSAGRMNLMLLGDETAQQLGVSPEAFRRLLLTAATLATAAAVAMSGLIGFVGLIVPHFCRLLWGPDYRILMPASILCGAAFLILADGLARTALAPQEIPVGIITALAGAPFFIAILRARGMEA
ncbi:MAG TPA: iron ABC transporter permease [Armatimonadota bacterium]|nr:iron ABC transporter permease [Armatimonadota bacterium]